MSTFLDRSHISCWNSKYRNTWPIRLPGLDLELGRTWRTNWFMGLSPAGNSGRTCHRKETRRTESEASTGMQQSVCVKGSTPQALSPGVLTIHSNIRYLTFAGMVHRRTKVKVSNIECVQLVLDLAVRTEFVGVIHTKPPLSRYRCLSMEHNASQEGELWPRFIVDHGDDPATNLFT